MSRETITHLNTQTLIGNTDVRGNAWHYRAEEQGDESNHYPGFIPVGDVERRLFSWDAVSRRLAVEVPAEIDTMTHLSEEGHPMRWVHLEDKQAISRSDDVDGAVMGIFAGGYEKHQYRQWLLNQVSNLLGDTLGITSAGILKEGAIAWVEVSVPESITTPEGVTFLPNLLCTTSFDGSIATTYKRSIRDTVCDNTRDATLAGAGEQYKVKHSRYSQLKEGDAREALSMIHTTADDFAAEIKAMCEIEVAPQQWTKFLIAHVPDIDAKTKEPLKGRSKTMADNKRSTLNKLYRTDLRVSPWAGTAHGVLQAVNTYEHHEGSIKGGDRAGRNQLMAVKGTFGALDRDAFETLKKVLANA
jgi:phage/plasmid-like protein (TIGR03299 family)